MRFIKCKKHTLSSAFYSFWLVFMFFFRRMFFYFLLASFEYQLRLGWRFERKKNIIRVLTIWLIFRRLNYHSNSEWYLNPSPVYLIDDASFGHKNESASVRTLCKWFSYSVFITKAALNRTWNMIVRCSFFINLENGCVFIFFLETFWISNDAYVSVSVACLMALNLKDWFSSHLILRAIKRNLCWRSFYDWNFQKVNVFTENDMCMAFQK